MYCNRCKQDKSPHLFQPSMIARPSTVYCSKCTAAQQGRVYGASRTAVYGNNKIRQAIKLEERLDDFRKQAREAEMKRILETRAKRLKSLESPPISISPKPIMVLFLPYPPPEMHEPSIDPLDLPE